MGFFLLLSLFPPYFRLRRSFSPLLAQYSGDYPRVLYCANGCENYIEDQKSRVFDKKN